MSNRRRDPQGIGVAELKRHFSEYLDRVCNHGERVVVRRRSRPVAQLVPVEEALAVGLPWSGRGLAAAAGAWSEHPDVAGFVRGVRAARRRVRERKIPSLG